MERREFFIKQGKILTTAAFLGLCCKSNPLFATVAAFDSAPGGDKRPNPADFSSAILKAIAIGINAPSPHNTQSWKFKITDDRTMYLYVDEHKLLPATDPFSRQIHMGAGCFIETLKIGASSLGFDTLVEHFPEGYESAKDFGHKPVAKMTLQPSTTEVHELAPYINKRQTNRRTYTGSIISKAEFETLKQQAGESYGRLVFINEGFQPYFDLFKRGFTIESRTYATNEETRGLFRFSAKQLAEKRDGISIPQMGYHGITKYFAERSLDDGDKTKWHSEKSIGLSLKKVEEGILSSKGLVIWVTPSNTFEDWVKAGRDFLRFSLALTKNGLYAHPYNQAIQEYDEMKMVRAELDKLLGVSGSEKIQMVIRVGRSSAPYLSYRRKLESYLFKGQ